MEDRTKIAVGVFDKWAKEYQEKFMDVSRYHASFDLFLNSLSENDPEVLEIACGPGNITRYLLSKRPDLRILGIDLAPRMLELAKLNNPAGQFELMDARDILRLEKKFKGILCGFCLPYLSKEEVEKLLSDARELLRPGGVLYLSTMEGDYDTSGFRTGSKGDQMYMYFHGNKHLTTSIRNNGFKVIEQQRITYVENNEATTDLILIVKKKN